MKPLLSLLVCAFLSVSATSAQDFEHSFAQTYKVSTPAKLDLVTSDGHLNIIPSSADEIRVFFIVRKAGKLVKTDLQKLKEDFIVEIESSSNAVKITVKDKRQYKPFSFEHSLSVGFKAYVPNETMCNLITSDGDITITGLIGDQHLKTSDGSIELTEIAGSISGRTSDGDVHIKKIKGNVEIQTSDGTINLESVGGDVIASTSDGNIRLNRVRGDIAVKTSDGYIDFREISGSFKASTSDGNIKGSVVELRKELTLRTSDGDIDVTLPAQLGLDLDIKAESIDVPFKNFTGKFDKTFVRGQSNGGGIPVVVTTSGGNVRLAH